jgi:hypothetical protein
MLRSILSAAILAQMVWRAEGELLAEHERYVGN